MMIPTSFDESNAVLDKPKCIGREDCTALSVLRVTDGNGFPVVISCWKLTKEELEEVNKTGRVWLGVLGTTMPPVYLTIAKPLEE